jgi:hypothetical protein
VPGKMQMPQLVQHLDCLALSRWYFLSTYVCCFV